MRRAISCVRSTARGWRRNSRAISCGLLEMALGAGEAAEAQRVDGAAQPDGRHHVLQRPPLGHVVVHVVGGDQAHARLGGEIVEQRQPARIVAAEQHGAGEIAAVFEQAGKGPQALAEGRLLGPARRQDDGQDAFGMGGEIVEGEVAGALGGAAVADRQQARQPLVGVEVGGIGEQRIAVARLETGADQELDLLFRRRRMLLVIFLDRRIGPHHAGQRVAVGDADGAVAEVERLQRELARMRAAAQEAVVGGDLQLGVHGPAQAASSWMRASDTPRMTMPSILSACRKVSSLLTRVADAASAQAA